MFKKILIYGENWEGTLPRLLLDELYSKNFEVEIFDFTDHLPGIRNRAFIEKAKRRLFSFYYKRKIQSIFLQKAKSFYPDVIIIAKGLHLDLETVLRLKRNGAKLINWNPDDFFNLKNSNASLIKAMPAYDLIISSRKHLFDKYLSLGATKLLYLEWYYVPQLHFDHKTDKTIEVSFVGSWSPSREKFISELNKKLSIWGGGWEKSSSAFRKQHDVKNKILNQVEMSKVFTSSKYNLNLLTHENNDYSNLRFFEVPASSGLLLTERNDIAELYLKDDVECLMFNSSKEVNEIFSKPIDLSQVCLSGYATIINSKNSFASRVEEMLSYIKENL